MSDRETADTGATDDQDGGIFATLGTIVRLTVLVLAAIGLVTVVGMVRTAREPYGGPLDA